VSGTGSTRTAPAPDARLSDLRVGAVNCQDWQNGYRRRTPILPTRSSTSSLTSATTSTSTTRPVCIPTASTTRPKCWDWTSCGLPPTTGIGRRKSDPAIQRAHGRFPLVLTWDDHEVENNYATFIDEINDTGECRQLPLDFARQRRTPIRPTTSTCPSARGPAGFAADAPGSATSAWIPTTRNRRPSPWSSLPLHLLGLPDRYRPRDQGGEPVAQSAGEVLRWFRSRIPADDHRQVTVVDRGTHRAHHRRTRAGGAPLPPSPRRGTPGSRRPEHPRSWRVP